MEITQEDYDAIKAEIKKLRAENEGLRLLGHAKAILMKRRNIDEETAYVRIRGEAMRCQCTVAEIALKIIRGIDNL